VGVADIVAVSPDGDLRKLTYRRERVMSGQIGARRPSTVSATTARRSSFEVQLTGLDALNVENVGDEAASAGWFAVRPRPRRAQMRSHPDSP
jgi:hypothetical protein